MFGRRESVLNMFAVVDGQVSAVNNESFVMEGRDSAVNKKLFFIFVEGRGSVLYCFSSCNEFVDMERVRCR